MKIVQQNKPQEMETQLNNERNITINNFHIMKQTGNALNYTDFLTIVQKKKNV